jgi:hypothetical protein
MKYTIEKLIYSPNEETGHDELWAWGEDEQGESFFNKIDLEDIIRQLKLFGCLAPHIHMAVMNTEYPLIDVFVLDNVTKINAVHSVIPKFKI